MSLRFFQNITKKNKSFVYQNAQDDSELKIKSKFRPYKELKRDFEELNMNIKTDLEILTDLTNEYRLPNCTFERKLIILADLEYLVHQVNYKLFL